MANYTSSYIGYIGLIACKRMNSRADRPTYSLALLQRWEGASENHLRSFKTQFHLFTNKTWTVFSSICLIVVSSFVSVSLIASSFVSVSLTASSFVTVCFNVSSFVSVSSSVTSFESVSSIDSSFVIVCLIVVSSGSIVAKLPLSLASLLLLVWEKFYTHLHSLIIGGFRNRIAVTKRIINREKKTSFLVLHCTHYKVLTDLAIFVFAGVNYRHIWW